MLSSVAIVRLTRDDPDDRPGGSAFGSLVHDLLARAPFDATLAALESLAAAEARLLGLDAPAVAAAAALVKRLFGHDLLARAALADARGACRREAPVTSVLATGAMIEGVVDLAFEEAGEWTVVDYKTDRELRTAGETLYKRQVWLYASAIARATGRPARAVLVHI